MNHPDDEWLLWLLTSAIVLYVVVLFWQAAEAYDTVDDPCGSGGLEVCDMTPLVTPKAWQLPCQGRAVPEVIWCERRRARHSPP